MKSSLFVWGGWEGHQPRETAHLFAELMRQAGCRVVIRDRLDVYEDPTTLRQFDLIVQCWTMGQLSPQQLQGLAETIQTGTGFAGWHGGLADSFRDSPGYQFIVGGQFVAHPGGVREYQVHVVDRQDSVMAGIDDFKVRSEQYYLHVDPSNQILADTVFSGEYFPWIEQTRMPVVWKRYWGSGKIFYCSLGHGMADFDVPEAREIVRRGLIWATR